MEMLKGNLRERVRDLREKNNWSQTDLAEFSGVSPSNISRIESGKTETVNHEVLLALARVFAVSTDYLLGETDDPEPKNYDLHTLGLSTEAAKKLYSGQVDADVVNVLLEHPKFGTLTRRIAGYWSGAMEAGYAAQNRLYRETANLLGTSEASDDVMEYCPSVQTELHLIQNAFAAILKSRQEDVSAESEKAAALTKEAFREITQNLQKGNRRSLRSITAEQLAEAVVNCFPHDGATSEMRADLKKALIPFFKKPAGRTGK